MWLLGAFVANGLGEFVAITATAAAEDPGGPATWGYPPAY